jgi:ferrous iron transport protein B
LQGGATEVATVFAITKVAGLAFLMLNLFIPPCFAAIGAMNSEIKSRKWFFAGIALQCAVGYTLGFLTYFFGTLFTRVGFAHAWMPIVGWGIVLAFAVVLAVLIVKKNKEMKKERAKE